MANIGKWLLSGRGEGLQGYTLISGVILKLDKESLEIIVENGDFDSNLRFPFSKGGFGNLHLNKLPRWLWWSGSRITN